MRVTGHLGHRCYCDISCMEPSVRHLVVRHRVGESSCLLSHDLRCCGGVGSDLLWDSGVGSNLLWDSSVGRSCSIGQSRLSILLSVNCSWCSCSYSYWGSDCLRDWVNVAVLVEVLGEALQVDGGETARGLNEVSVCGGERTKLGTLVEM